MKNFYTLLLSGLLLCLSCGISAQDELTIGLSDVSGNVGETVCIDLVGENFVAISGMQFSITFDTMVLELVSATGNINGTNVSMVNRPNAPNLIRVVYSPFSSTGYTDPGPFVIGQICFRILQDVETDVEIGDSPTPLEFTNDSQMTFGPDDVIINNGTVNGGSTGGATCSDGVRNGSETGVDCGGPDCPACPTATCSDGIQNGDETGVDCGGSCTACPTVPTCSDGIMNGDETGVDCGGSCTPCDNGGGNATCGEGSSQLNICLTDACDAAVGATACVDLLVHNFTDVTALQMRVNYPSANLDYASFTQNAALTGALQVNEANDGELRLLFFRSADSPVTLADNDVFATLCFTNETTSTTLLDATNLIVSRTTGSVVNPIANDGRVNGNGCGGGTGSTCNDGIQNGGETGVDCGGPDCAACPVTTCGEGTTDVEICVGSVCGDAGTEVCVPVMVGNFDDLGGIQFSLEFAAGNLEFSGFNVASELELGTQITPPSMNGMPTDGIVNVIWNDPNLTGVTIGADVVAFEVCFTVENAAATPLTFRDPSTTLKAFNATGGGLPITSSPGAVNQNCGGGGDPTCTDGIRNGNETGVDCGGDCDDCPVAAGCGEGSDRLNVCLADVCDVAVNGQACMEITTNNFTNIVGFQFNLLYPAANLDYATFTPNNRFGNTIQVNEAADGEVRFVFFDASNAGISLQANEAIGTICFTNEVAGQTTVDLDNLRFSSTSGTVIGPVGNDGTVNTPGCGMADTCNNGVKDGNEDGIDCGGGCPTVCPTCNDGIMNGDETGVDCGGSCSPCPTSSLGLNVGSGTGQLGQQVCVDIRVMDFAGISDISLTLNYDPAVLVLASITANAGLPGFGASNFNTNVNGQVMVSYDPATAQSLANGESLFEICFNIIGTDETNITLTDITATNAGGEDLTINPGNGVINAGGVVDYENLTLVAGNVSGAEGTQVCLDVSTFNLTDLAGLQFGIAYDATKLQFVNATGTGELPGLQAVNSSAGFIRVIWFDPNVGANSVDDGRSILNICFTVLEACEASIAIDEEQGFRIRATDSNNTAVTPVDGVAGSVNGSVNCGGGDCNPSNVVLRVGSADGTVGTEVCIDVTAENFTSLSDLDFSLTYDPAKVTFTRATNFGLGSITSANVTNNAANGTIAFEWDAPGSTGQSLPDGNAVVGLCFTVDRFEVTPVNFANSPVVIQARAACGQAAGVVPSGGNINPNAPVIDGLTFQIGSATADAGDEICLPIIGFEVDGLVSFQYSINYDPAILEYIGTGPNYAFNGFSDGSVRMIQPGVLTVAWADPFANGNSVANGEALYSICFRVLSTTQTPITFNDTPTPIEFEDVNSIVEADLLNGQVNGTAAPVIVDSDIDRPSCSGDADGSISLTVSGGNNLSYMWSPNTTTTGPTASNLTAGTYNVTVTNQTTSQSTTSRFEVTAGSDLTVEVGTVRGVTCSGDRDGSIRVVALNGEPTLLYNWSGSLPDNGPQQTMLPGGSYSVTVTDGNGCARAQNNIMVGEPAELRIVGSPNNIPADGPGGVTVEIVGGRAPFDYSWTGPGNYTSDDEDLDDVTVSGTYCLTVTDNGGCAETQCFGVTELLAASAIVERGCFGQNNAAIGLTVVGGAGNYDYEWTFVDSSGDGPNPAGTTQDINGLEPGDYTVQITSGTSVINFTVTVEPAEEIILTDVSVTPSTSGDNGTITLRPSGGNSPYTYEWDNGETTQNLTGLSARQYCVTVTDASDCTAEMCYTVGSDATSFTSVSIVPTNCSDSDDGTIRLVLGGASAPLSIRVEPLGLTTTSATTDANISVPAGTYTVFVTDGQGTMLDTMVTVTTPDPLVASGSPTSDTEDMNCSGMISLNISGGTGPYAAAWSNGETGIVLTRLCAGDYTPTITDANGCTLTGETFTVGRIDEELGPNGITDVACADGTEGAVDVTVTGGVTPYVFSWTRTGGTDVLSTSEDLLAAEVTGGVTDGNYTLTITDATGATLTKNYTVGTTAGFSVGTVVTSDFNGFDVSCPDASDGRIVITISGQGEFMYEFTRDGAMVGVDSVLENAMAGDYVATVIGPGGCEVNRTVTLTAPPAITIASDLTPISCGNTADGAIAVTPGGGRPTYTILWSTGETTPRISGIGTGEYGVTVTDGNGCTATENFTLRAPEDLAFTVDPVDATDGCNGSIRVLPLGGSGNYRYEWPQLPMQGNDPFAEGLCPGEYTIQITDDNECQTFTMTGVVRDRRFPCLNAREVITPNGDGLNEKFVIFCSGDGEAIDNNLQVYNRWGQLVYRVDDYDCSSDDRGTNCFEGRTNDGTVLPDGPYYYIFEFKNTIGEEMQQRGALSILRD